MYLEPSNHPIQQRLTLQQMIDESCRKNSAHIALTFTDEEPICYSELKRQIDQLSSYLKNEGVAKGDRVAILSENSPQWGIAYFAITTMGAVAVPIIPEFHTSEIHHILRHSDSKVIFISERFFHKIEEIDFSEFNSIILLNDFSIATTGTSKA